MSIMSTDNIPTDAAQEKDGEAADLVEKIKEVITTLNAGDLKADTLHLLARDIDRLAEIGEAREGRVRRIEKLQIRLQNWRRDNSEVLSTAAKLKEIFGKLEERIDADAINQETLDTILDKCGKASDLHKQLVDLQKDLEQANREENFNRAVSLLSELSSLKDERDRVCEQVIADLLEHSEERPTLESSQAEENTDIKELAVKSREQQKDDDAETSQPEPHQETATSLDSEAENVLEAIPSKERIAPDKPEEDSSREGPLEIPSEDRSSRDELSEPTSETFEQLNRTNDIQKGIAKALERRRFGVAYHLALIDSKVLPDSDTVKLIAANYVTDKSDPVSYELHNIVGGLLNKANTKQAPHDYSVLVVSAALSPALIAPGGPFIPLFSDIEPSLGDMKALRALAQATAEVSQQSVVLSIELLQGDFSLEDWKERVSTLQKEGENWIRAERQAKLRFAPATVVWRRILEEWKEEKGSASIGYMFKLMIGQLNGASINNKEVLNIAQYWRQNSEREIDRIDQLRRESSTKKIEGSARSALLEKISKAVSFADRWNELIKTRPDKMPSFLTKQVEKLRSTVREHGSGALEEIAALNSSITPQSQELVCRFIDKFSDSPQMEPSPSRLRLEDLLNRDLLVNPNIPFDKRERGTVEVGSLLRLAEQDEFDFKNAIIERAKQGDFRGAEAIFDFADRSMSLDEDSANRIRTQIDEERRQLIERLTSKIHNANNQLDAAYAQGILTANEIEQQRLDISQDDLTEDDDFKLYDMEIRGILATVHNGKQKRCKELEEQLASLTNVPENDRNRIQEVIENNLFQVAEDAIERIKSGERLSSFNGEKNRAFDAFFPDFVKEYAAFRDQTEDPLSLAQEALKKEERVGPVDATRLSKGTPLDGALLLQSWSELRDLEKITHEKLKAFIKRLGFTNGKLSPYDTAPSAARETSKLLEVEPLADRQVVQLPDFGSRADGRYRLIVIHGSETEEAIIQAIGERKLDGQPPNIVFFFNFLDTEARHELARSLGSGNYHPTLVLDEALVIFLATQSPSRRLASFFDCTAAFAFAQPFEPDAPEVPPEMFFGRKKEREKILAMSGDMAHLVYGGRRLGKTAVLKDITREYRSQGEKKLILFLDLKPSGIGESRQTKDLWMMFAEQLEKHNIVPRNTIRVDSIKTKVQEWLKEDGERRILFLVDEADKFLDAERHPDQGYQVLDQIRSLMEETGRRFKVVFAGLHNVQRAARDPNTPFAHLGEPVRVGPMLPDTDGEEIENLIRAPLETLGYRFDSSDLVVRIAAETNYYPVLVQQFCKELLRDLRENELEHSQSGPPYLIRPEAVDRIFDSKETRDRIRYLFAKTIELDPRYEFLTYLIAQRSFDNDAPWPRSVPIEEIRTAALHEWRQGFDSDPSFLTFQVLLEEMVGLGILREVQGEGFAIRTRNLRMLLGNDTEIEQRFSDAKDKTVFPPNPSQFRHTLDDRSISSLSAGLEEKLLSNKQGVGLIFGTRLAGLDRISESFAEVTKKKSVELHGPFSTYQRNTLRSATRTRSPGIHIVLVDMRRFDWQRDWIEQALESVAKIDAQRRTIRPVFVCNPKQAWRMMEGLYPMRKGNVELWEIWLGPCAKGFAHAWLKDLEAPAYADLENQDSSVDAPWPAIVETAAGEKQLQSMKEAATFLLEDRELVADILEIPETRTGLSILSEFGDPISAIELSDLSSGDLSQEQAERILDWASRLGIVQRDDTGYRLDTAYEIGLKRFFQE